jgi:transcriptional regulator with XRE-family HTH domain
MIMMRGMVSVDDVIASLPKKRQEAIRARADELIAQTKRRMTLAEMRKSRKISQSQMAEVLGIGQMQISRLEKRKDPRLSTMQRTIAAMGGHLTLIATFPDQEPIFLVTSQVAKESKHADKPRAKKPAVPQRRSKTRARA